jgi:hypothetical protein
LGLNLGFTIYTSITPLINLQKIPTSQTEENKKKKKKKSWNQKPTTLQTDQLLLCDVEGINYDDSSKIKPTYAQTFFG